VKKLKNEITTTNVIELWANQHPKVMTWLSKLQSKKLNAFHLYRYCQYVNKTPEELLELKSDRNSTKAEELLDGFIVSSEKTLTNSQIVNIAIAVKSFYKKNYSQLESASGQITFIKSKPYRKHTKEEVLKIYRSTQNPRDRALITFVFSTAIAKESLTKLQWKHLDADWEQQELPHIGLPSEIVKGHGIGKYKGVEQHTFLTPEAKKDLIDYKNHYERKAQIKFSENDSIFIDLDNIQKKTPIGYKALGQIPMVLSERSGIPFSWHDARRYVETALEEIKIHPNWARKIRGRKVKGEEAPYSRPAIEQLRKAYREAVPLLEFTQPTSLMQLKERQEVVERLNAKMIDGQPLDEKDKADIKRFGIPIPTWRKKAVKTEHNGGQCKDGKHCGEFEQIAENQLLSYLKSGWTIVKELQNGDIIVKR
jgi:hypothetical protein